MGGAMSHPAGQAAATAAAEPRIGAGSLSDYLELTKPRVTSLVVTTTAFGFYLGSRGRPDLLLFFHCMLGTWLVAAGTSALNQVLERESDGKMERTRRRPLPDGRLQPVQALGFATLLATAGMLYLAVTVNLLTALLAAATLASYIFLYTPLKARSPLATLVGAVPGALPPLGGWAAAAGSLGAGGWALFTILFLWQLPHSLAIAWMYKEDYARGGFRVLPVVDPEGGSTVRQILGNALALVPVSLTPALFGVAGAIYFYGALLLGLFLLWHCVGITRDRGRAAARRVVLASVIYLPALLLLMALDKLP
jgi:protoheme IX farnesyltransferase